MKEDIIIKQKWVKRAAFIFTVIMLLLTLFSNTIMNISLPEVYVKQVEDGKIKYTIEGYKNAEAVSSYNVIFEQSRKIKEVLIGVGDFVKEGDILFTLEDGDSPELEDALNALEDLEFQKEKMQINSESNEYAETEREINKVKEKIAEIKSLCAKLGVSTLEMKEIDETISSNVNIEKDIEKEIKDLQKEILNIAHASDDEMRSLKRQIEDKQKEITQQEQNPNISSVDIDALKLELKRLEEDYEKLYKDNKDYTELSEHVQRQENLLEAEQEKANPLKELKNLHEQLDDLLFNLEQQKKQDDKTQKLLGLDYEKLLKDISKQKSLIEKLRTVAENGSVSAAHDGIVSTINVSSGSIVAPNSSLAEIETAEQGYIISLTTTKEMSKHISVGDQAKTNDSNVTATLSQIKNEPNSGGDRKTLIFKLNGEIKFDEEYEIFFETQGKQYDIVIPKSALFFDNTGSFVLTVKSKRTPFGTRYETKRIPVEVLEMGMQNVAIEADGITDRDFVITASTKPLSDKTQIRMSYE